MSQPTFTYRNLKFGTVDWWITAPRVRCVNDRGRLVRVRFPWMAWGRYYRLGSSPCYAVCCSNYAGLVDVPPINEHTVLWSIRFPNMMGTGMCLGDLTPKSTDEPQDMFFNTLFGGDDFRSCPSSVEPALAWQSAEVVSYQWLGYRSNNNYDKVEFIRHETP